MRPILALTALLALLAAAAAAGPAAAGPLEESCSPAQGPLSLRQTLLVIDGALVVPDTAEGPAPQNKAWRRFAAQYFDAASPAILQLMDARERLTVAIANADGSGLTVLFSGCLPLVAAEEASRRDAETGAMDRFFGRDWRSLQEKSAEGFTRAATLALMEGVTRARIGPAAPAPFPEGGLVRSLLRTRGFTLENGLPRLVLLTDLSLYETAAGSGEDAHASGRMAAERAGFDLQRAEVHLFDAGTAAGEAQAAYLKSFFLASKGQLKTIAGIGGALSANAVPVASSVFQGTIVYPSVGEFPIRMRLARDRNGSVVMSWIEEQSTRTLFSPFEGLLNCESEDRCTFIGDKVFAQVWKETPDPRPQCDAWIPFGGFRDLAFTVEGETLTGRTSDEICLFEVVGDSLSFTLQRVKNGAF
ncbi:hypothetical protein [Aurantimonas sp. Leaf443]|uniref:hypothetical protein n=1 Tax=Aurantimonas sp. Leaf443 TaxID=1736378 RepID=UPI000700F2EE|nr:hypothetical protein [Aurantimonas sp. Leaf443]KQT87159.1 hypothetical protein ASG48_17530 [Aurantimonas sp. Leaf443]